MLLLEPGVGALLGPRLVELAQVRHDVVRVSVLRSARFRLVDEAFRRRYPVDVVDFGGSASLRAEIEVVAEGLVVVAVRLGGRGLAGFRGRFHHLVAGHHRFPDYKWYRLINTTLQG